MAFIDLTHFSFRLSRFVRIMELGVQLMEAMEIIEEL